MGLRQELVFAKTIVLLAKIEAFNFDIFLLDKGKLSKDQGTNGQGMVGLLGGQGMS